ncbi:MAG TPA: efflux RND transporter periplasmic adaptor subunit [Steroidobacteraceae bacterium]|nr:efflux RND transporter periplasmic adaptor subunit [Steroidobacteraceae bacterium]
MPPDPRAHRLIVPLLLAVAASLAGCSRQGAAPPQAGVEVKAVTAQPGSTDIYRDLVGEVRGSKEVEIRARVSGILLGKHFEDGSLVNEGDLLYTIDAREYRAQVATAEAQLAAAQANLARAQQDVERYEPLLRENAISRQVYDTAVAAAKQADAQVEASRAAITEAKLGVEFASVRAPLTGRIGASQVFEGALITAGQTLLATISADDPAWVYFSVSEADLLSYERRLRERGTLDDDASRTVRLQLSDGSMYPHPGIINFADRALDPTTGTYRLRAEFPNSEHLLRPGLFARIRVIAERRSGVIMLPDRAVQQQLGRYFVTVVGEGDKAETRPVELGPRLGNRVVIEQGLEVGDRVVVEGIQKARPGTPLIVTMVTPEELAAPSAARAAPQTGNG